ncbi:hypothetical protein [Candidatus Arsenophonus triatominarum]|uniref:hypothetical protein n=1 Tax=Candidatus Arsenophonus triatominarum TaxID=57911 RepID=UPI003CCB914F
MTDTPYYRVKSCAWDRQWKTTNQYLTWLDDYLVEFQRILKPNGSRERLFIDICERARFEDQ